MKELQRKIMIMLQRVQNMNKDNTIGIVSELESKEQAVKFLNWLKKQPLEQMKRTEIINQLERITEN